MPGEEHEDVFSAISFLKDVYDGKQVKVGNRVVVVGGGFTAVDAARTAKRLGANEVYIAYRRTRDEMPATQEEIAEAEAEGIKVMYLVSPKAIIHENGKLKGIHMANQVLGEKDKKDRRKPEEVDTADFVLKCNTIISAIGQEADNECVSGLKINKYGMLECDPQTGETNIEGVFAGGDVNNVTSVISAIAAGKRAACSIDKYLAKEDAVLEYEPEAPVVSKEAVLRRVGYFKDEAPIDLTIKDGSERAKAPSSFSTYIRTLTEEEAVAEAKRCLNCGCGEGCGLCASICSEFAIHVKEPDVWEIDKDECVACGMCYNRCPNGNIEMINTNAVVK